MDRQIVYAGAAPLDTDILSMERNIMQAFSALMNATLGGSTICDGLAVTPTTVPSMAVTVGIGMITFPTTVDTSQFGSEAIDNTYCLKMGINTAPVNLAITAPTVSGYSTNYLIEAAFLEEDVDPVVLQYYNAANPSQPFSGPANNGLPNYTVRSQVVSLQAKAGTQALTGEQATPSADTGYTPLAVVTVPYGATSITSGMIALASGPFVGTKLGQLRTKLTSNLTLYVAGNGSDTVNSGLSPNVPLATPQGAWNMIINNYDLNGYSATINIGAGNFGAMNCSGQPQGYGANSTITILGAGNTTILTSTGLQAGVGAGGGASVTVTNLQVQGTTGILADTGSQVTVGSNVVFANCSSGHIVAIGGIVVLFGNYSIQGSGTSVPAHWITSNGGSIQCFGTPIISGNSAQFFSTAFAYLVTGNINVNVTFTGTGAFTGSQFNVTGGGFLNRNGVTLPGNSAGTAGSGSNIGFYI